MSDDVKVTITADDKPLKDAFDRAAKSINDFGNNAQKAIGNANNYATSMSSIFAGGVAPAIEQTTEAIKETGKQASFANDFMEQFRVTTLGVAAGQFVFQAINDAIRFVKDSIKESVQAFAEQEDAINKLKQSFILTGGASQSAVDGVQAFATALESSSRFADENIIKQVAYIKSLGTSTAAAKEFVKAAANMSAVVGGSLEENTEKLGLTLSGTAGRLTRLIPDLKTLTIEQLKAGDAAEIINKKFGGSSANDLKTYSGSMESLHNSFNNVQETIGEVIAKSAPWQAFLKTTKEYIDDINSSVKASAVNLDITSGSYNLASKTSQQLALDSQTLGDEIKKLQEELKGSSSADEFFFADVSNGASASTLQIEGLIAAKEKLDEKLLYQSKSRPKEEPDVRAAEFRTLEQLNTEKKLRADLHEIKLQATNSEKDFDDQLFISQQDQAKIRGETITQAVYDQKMREADAVYQGEIEKNKVIQDAKERQLTNNIALEKKETAQIAASRVKRLADEKAAKAGDVALELSYQNSKNTIIMQGFTLAATLAKDGSATQFMIQKAAALANIAMGLGTALALIPAQTAMIPFPGNIAAAAQLATYDYIQAGMGTAIVAAQALKFETGGIVPGLNQYGDQVQARLNPGEVVLNNTQQQELLNVANGRSNNGNGNMLATIVDAVRNVNLNISIDGREIARVVRDQRAAGYAV